MKKRMMTVLCFVLAMCLWGCGTKEMSVPETTAVPTEVATVPTEPTPMETEAKHNTELYELDTSEYDFTFEKVLLKIDWTDMTFALKCFDGSVVTGIVERNMNNISCIHENGRLMLTQYLYNGKMVWGNTNYSYDEERYYAVDQLMFCPQTDIEFSYRFVRAEDQEQEIIADPDVVPLDSYKHVFAERYYFHDVIEEQGERIGCGMTIYHFPMQNKWSFVFESRQTDVDHTENPDGTITFSYKGKQWNFHREGDLLYFDGGDALIADNGVDSKESYYRKMDVPVGAAFYLSNTNYVYDALNVLPGSTLEECYAAIQLDTKNQWIKIQCWDGNVLRGPYTFIDNYNLYCNFEVPDYVGTRTAYISLTPNDHALGVSNGWMLNIGPGEMGDRFYFFPVKGVTTQETIEE